jgi:hypothetical protein
LNQTIWQQNQLARGEHQPRTPSWSGQTNEMPGNDSRGWQLQTNDTDKEIEDKRGKCNPV